MTIALVVIVSLAGLALGPVLADAVTAVRLGEAEAAQGLDDAQVAAAYRWVY